MKKTLKYIFSIMLVLAATISLWFLLNNLQPLSPGLYSFAAVSVFALIIIFILFGGNLKNKVSNLLKTALLTKRLVYIMLPIILLFGVSVRLYFYLHFSYTPVSDPMTFFEAGKRIAEGHGMIGDTYAAFFPYLAAYNGLLGFTMGLISDPWLATIALNTTFDIGAAFAIFFIAKRLSKSNSKLPLIAFAVWLLSPFSILFSLISLPIVIVNFFIITSVLLVSIFVDSLKKKNILSSLLIASLIGLVAGLGNSFRPVFVIVIVALFLLFLYLFLLSKERLSLSIVLASSYVIVVTIFLIAQQLNLTLVAKATGISPPSNSSGWSIFVGANWSSQGKWNHEDEIRMSQICSDTKQYEECHKKLREAGIERYKSYGVVDTINLFIRKLYIFSSNQSNVYNANMSINNYTDSKSQKIFSIYLTTYILTLFYLCFRFFYQTSKLSLLNKQVSPVTLFVALIIIGFFLSAMLVETSERYAQIMYPLFILAAVLGLSFWKKTIFSK